MGYRCDCVSDVQVEVANGERCAETLITVGLMHVEMKLCQRGERLHVIATQTFEFWDSSWTEFLDVFHDFST